MTKIKKPVEESAFPNAKKENQTKKTENKPVEEVSKEKIKIPEKEIIEKKETEDKKIKKQDKPKVKKTEAIVYVKSLPISTKYAIEICKFIKYKKIEDAISDLEQVHAKRKAVPMKGEYGHKKGKRMAGGKYPKKASEYFIILLKSLAANSIANGLDEPIISEAISNLAPRQMAKFGRWQRKRTHVKLIAREKKKKPIKKESKK